MGTRHSLHTRAVGSELRAALDRSGLKISDVAAALKRHHTTVSRWTTGATLISEADAAAVLDLCRVSEDERVRVLGLVRDAAASHWVIPGVDRRLAELMDTESRAKRITNIQPLMIPGLLQIEEYTRAIVQAVGATAADTELAIRIRMGRQAVLARREPPAPVCCFVIGDHAVRDEVAARPVMLAQLRHLQEAGRHPHVAIQVLQLRNGPSPAREGGFVLLEFPNLAPAVQFEHRRWIMTTSDAGDVADYKTTADTIRRQAMTRAQSRAYIANLIAEMENG